MLNKIFLDNNEFHFTESELPLLIHGEEPVGASLFTMSVLATLCSQGAKVVALTGYPYAREEFIKQTGTEENAQFFTKEKTEEFLEFVSKTSDISDYVILLKNIEFYSRQVFNAVKNLKNLILSGDVNKCSFKEELSQYSFNTKIYFSQLTEPLPELQKYESFMVSEKQSGVLSLEMYSNICLIDIYPTGVYDK